MDKSPPQIELETPQNSADATSRWTATFGALRDRHFRWYWMGRLTSLAAFQMDAVAQGWLVYNLTGSALSLGWISASRSATLLFFSLYGGVISDRFDKRSILIWIRWIRLAAHIVIAMLISLGAIRVWHLAVRSLLSGILLALIMPAERAIVPELVDRQALLNAFSLTAIATGLMGMLSAWAGGLLIEAAGVAVAYYAICAFHLLTVLVVAQLPVARKQHSATNPVLSEFVDVIRYILRRPTLLMLLGLALAVVVFARPYRTLMPKYAKEVMGLEAAGLGFLLAAPQLGSLLSSLAMATLRGFGAKGKLLLAAGAVLGLSLLIFVSVRPLPLVLLTLALVGAMNNTCLVTNQTLLQVNAADRFLGRVTSVYIMMSGLAPLGTLTTSALADRIGVPIAVGIQGALLVAVFGAMALFVPRVRGLE